MSASDAQNSFHLGATADARIARRAPGPDEEYDMNADQILNEIREGKRCIAWGSPRNRPR
jgi:hypothetical protein